MFLDHFQPKLRHNYAFDFCVVSFPGCSKIWHAGYVRTWACIRLTFSTAKLREQSNGNSQFEAEVPSWQLKIARSKILRRALRANDCQLHHQHQAGPDHPQIASGGPELWPHSSTRIHCTKLVHFREQASYINPLTTDDAIWRLWFWPHVISWQSILKIGFALE